jgi:hypothetical protein
VTIPSAPAPSTPPNAATGDPPAPGATPLPTAQFEHYLPADSAGDPKAHASKAKSKTEHAKADDGTVPSSGEQTNLAALLYTLPAPKPVLLPNPGGATDAAVGGEPQLPKIAELEGPEGAARRTIQPAGSISPGRSVPVLMRPVSGDVAVAVDKIPNNSAQGPEDAAAPAVNETAKPPTEHAVEFAGPPKADANSPKISPANPAGAASAIAPLESATPENQSLGDADTYLIPETESPALKTRGTGGAKAGHEMNETSATNSNSPSSAPVGRPTGAVLNAPVAGIEDKLPGRGKSPSQDSTAIGNNDANRGGTATLSVATTGLPASLGHSTSANGADPSTLKPMTPAAIVGEVGLGLERIQQSGNDRVDLRLSLEGGGQVSIELQMRDGAVHTSIVTGSPELRAALQQDWSQLSNRSESLGMTLASPVFKTPPTTATTTGQQDFRERRDTPRQEQNSAPIPFNPSHQPKRPGPFTATTLQASSGLNAWA